MKKILFYCLLSILSNIVLNLKAQEDILSEIKQQEVKKFLVEK